MNLLDNELVKKYFECDTKQPHGHADLDDNRFTCRADMALRILTAMQEPVVEGKLYLAVSEYGKVTGPVAFTSTDHHKHHGHWLVLPDRFQPLIKDNPMECGCRTWRHEMCHKPPKQEFHYHCAIDLKTMEHRPGSLCSSQPKRECTCKVIHFDPCNCSCHKAAPSKVEEKIDEEIEKLKKELHAIVQRFRAEK